MLRKNINALTTDISTFNEYLCLKILQRVRWSEGNVSCIRCGSPVLSIIGKTTRKKAKKYACLKCKYQFSDMSGTIFHKTRTPLSKWFYTIYLVGEREYITAHRLKNLLGVTYKTAWRMLSITRNSPLAVSIYQEIKREFFHSELYYQKDTFSQNGSSAVKTCKIKAVQ